MSNVNDTRVYSVPEKHAIATVFTRMSIDTLVYAHTQVLHTHPQTENISKREENGNLPTPRGLVPPLHTCALDDPRCRNSRKTGRRKQTRIPEGAGFTLKVEG